MNPNIYDYATTEYAQDAFIAWMCDNFHSTNPNKKHLAIEFIDFLFEQGKVPSYTDLKVDTQPSDIDVLVTFIDQSGNEVHYLIVEDKTFSEEHDDQIRKYINTLTGQKGCQLDQISVAYYKTGHLTVNDQEVVAHANRKNMSNNIWNNYKVKTTTQKGIKISQKILLKSEVNRLNDLKINLASQSPSINSFNICNLQAIENFFQSHKSIISNCQSEIIDDYTNHLLRHISFYKQNHVPKGNNTSILWIKVFDEFISINKNNWPGLRFSANTYNGKYTELLISHSSSSTSYFTYDTPVISIRSSLLFSKFEIKFLNHGSCNYWIPKITTNPKIHKDQFFSYQLPINNFGNIDLNTFNPSLYNAIPINWLNTLLVEICNEYLDILNNKHTGFSL